MVGMMRCSSLLVTISLMVFTPAVFAQSACSGGSTSLAANGFAQNLTSPNYPSYYPDNSNCKWIITAASPSQVVVLNVLDFSLETSTSSCPYDYVTLYDGRDSYYSTIQKFCNQPLITQFVSTGSFMTVAFRSDSSTSSWGFKFEYTSQNKSALCGNAVLSATSTAKNFYSPGYNYIYPNDMDCQWTINADSYQRVVVLNVLNMYLQGSPPYCTDDYLSLYDGNSKSSSKIQTLCGQVSPHQFASTGSSMTVVFRSDASISFKGFQFQYASSYASDTCSSSSLAAASYAQYITSPNYPNYYSSNTDCTWVITASLSTQVVVLKLIAFSLEGTSTSCYSANDYVTIYDGSSTSSTSLQKLCGTQANTDVVSTGSSMTVRFHSDGSTTYRGFKLQYTSSAPSDVCSSSPLTAYSSAQYITSPNYPNVYFINTDCTWVITASLSSQVVVLKLIDFYLEGTSISCSYDYVTIYDGSSTSSTSLQTLCGLQTTNTQFVSTGSSMTVSFHSDSSNNYKGFKLQYTSSAKSDVCSGQSLTAYSTTSYLTSPNYPSFYPNNMNCEWHISASLVQNVVVLELISLSLEGSGSFCFNDYVNVYDGSSKYSTQITSLCGTKYSGTYTSSGSDMTVVFRSDSSIHNSGFCFSYHSQEKSDSSSLSAGAIVGIVICCIAVPCIIVAVIILYRKHTTRQQIRNSQNRAQVQTARTTTVAPAVSYVANNPPAVPAPYMMQNPPQMMPMGAPAYVTNYLPPSYSYAMQPGAVPHGQPPFGAPGPSFVGAVPTQNDGGHINKGFNGDSAPTAPS